MKKQTIEDDFELLKKELLPKMLNLHLMRVEAVQMNSEPIFINDGHINQMISDRKTWDITLNDVANDIKAVVTISKTYYYELK